MCTYCLHGCKRCNGRGHTHTGTVGPCDRCARIMAAKEGCEPTYDPDSDPLADPLPEERLR